MSEGQPLLDIKHLRTFKKASDDKSTANSMWMAFVAMQTNKAM